MGAAPEVVFFAVSTIIFIGFLASALNQKSKVPEMLWLIVLGLAIGPINAAFFRLEPLNSIANRTFIEGLTPYLSALALAVIMFKAGLNLDLKRLLDQLAMVTLHTTVAFCLTAGLVVLVLMSLLAYPPMIALMLAVNFGGTSATVMVAVMERMRMGSRARNLLTLEAVLTSALSIVILLELVDIQRGAGQSLAEVMKAFLASVSVPIVIGFAVGVVWLKLLPRIQRYPFAFMATVATLLTLYALTVTAGGSGPVAALVFGLVLGNGRKIGWALRTTLEFPNSQEFRQFFGEITFVITTFFFVLLGLLFTFDGSSGQGGPFLYLLAIALCLGVIQFGRWATALLTVHLHNDLAEDRPVLWRLIPRGLSSTIMAVLPFDAPEFADPTSAYHQFMAPYQQAFLDLTFLIILVTILVTALSAFGLERRRAFVSVGPRDPIPLARPAQARDVGRGSSPPPPPG